MPRAVTIIMYHYIRDLRNSRHPNIKGLDIRLFREQIEYLSNNYTIITMESLIAACDAAESGEGAALPENAALLTFDDGYLDHYTNVFPLLDALGVQGSFFFPTKSLMREAILEVNKIHLILASAHSTYIYGSLLSLLDRHRGVEFPIPDNSELIHDYAIPYYYDGAEIGFIKRMLQTALPRRLRELITNVLFHEYVPESVNPKAVMNDLYCDVHQALMMKRYGMYIGVHGNSHEWLGNIEQAEAEDDIRAAVGQMNEMGLIDPKAWVMNYPYGSWNDNIVQYIRDRGCALGLTTRKGVAAPGRDDRLLLPRMDTNDFPPIKTARTP